MITGEDILSLNYYNHGNAFTGSYEGMRYRIKKQTVPKEQGDGAAGEDCLQVVVWPEPFSFEKTEDEKKTFQMFPFNEEGKRQAVDWLNHIWADGEWQPGFSASVLRRMLAAREAAEENGGEVP